MTIDSIGDIEETVQEVANLTRSLERQLLINFSASNLPKSDLAGVTVHQGKFDASAMGGSDFSGADLAGSSFKASDLRGANFAGADLTGSAFYASDLRDANLDGANLTDCTFSASDLGGASFNQTILVRTGFNTSNLARAKFANVRLIDAKLTWSELKEATFENCIFSGVDFSSDLRGVSFDGQTFIGVRFDKAGLNDAPFQGATLRNVSFTPPWSLSKKYYNAIKTIKFDGASMDKLTYAALKGLGADMSKVTVV